MNITQPVTDHNNDTALACLFTTIFKEHEYRLYTLVLKLTKSDLYAKDVIQEVFMRLWENRDCIQDIENIEAWLYRLTENKVIDFLRKASANRRLREAVWNNLQQVKNETETFVAAREYLHIIQTAIDQLPPQRKLIYQLNRENGLSYKQIADELHISKHTVKNQLSTAIHSIRKWFLHSTRLFSLFF
jgi:RNA polymerase sigma-70 factor (family 1)